MGWLIDTSIWIAVERGAIPTPEVESPGLRATCRDSAEVPGQVLEALHELARLDARQARIVELKYFAGMSEQEVAAALSLSRATVTREWQAARAWLFRRMTGGTGHTHT